MSEKEKEIQELKDRLNKLEGEKDSGSNSKDLEKKNLGCFGWFFIILIILFVIGTLTDSDDSDGSDFSSDDDISMKLTCKLNPNAMYEDRITFNGDMTTATLESTNKNTPITNYKVKKDADNLILNGTLTRIDIDKNKTLIPDVDLFVLTEGKSDYWNWDLYYFTDFETNPVRYLTCHETYNLAKKDKVEQNEKPKADVAKQNREKIVSSLAKQGFNSYWGQDISLWIENPGYSYAELESFGYKFCDATKSAGMTKSYTITFWQSLRNGPNGQILKVRCF